MNSKSASALAPGLYLLHWKRGGSSIAAVGILQSGARWFAPADWTSVSTTGIASANWRLVARAERIDTTEALP